MTNQRPNGHYRGPLSLSWCSYSNTLRAMPMNYLAADLSRIDASLWGREGEIGALLAEAPAMVAALRDTIADLDGVTGIDEHGSDTIGCIENRLRAILSRIDGAGDTLPDAPAPAPTGELGKVEAVQDAAAIIRDGVILLDAVDYVDDSALDEGRLCIVPHEGPAFKVAVTLCER